MLLLSHHYNKRANEPQWRSVVMKFIIGIVATSVPYAIASTGPPIRIFPHSDCGKIRTRKTENTDCFLVLDTQHISRFLHE